MRISFSILFVAILFAASSISAQEYTPYMLTGGLGISGNIHKSAFVQLPNIQNCCTQFTGGFGLGSNVFAGVEMQTDKKVFGRGYNAGVALSFSFLSAPLVEEEFIANVIQGNSALKANVEHRIDAAIPLLAVEPYFMVFPSDGLPLGVKIGAQAGIPVGASFTQKETLLSPADATFETGTRVRNEKSGSLDAGFYAALMLGVRYDISAFDNFILSSEAQYNIALTKILSNIDWRVNSLHAGIHLRYRIPVTIPPPPPPPPPPVIVVKRLTLNAEITIAENGKERILNNGEIIKMLVSETSTARRCDISSVVFYPKNSAEIPPAPAFIKTAEDAQRTVFSAVAQYLKANPGVSCIVFASASAEEESGIAEQRAKNAVEFLRTKGIAPERLTIRAEHSSNTDIRHEELREELRLVRFVFSDKRELLRWTETENTTRTFDIPTAFARPRVLAEAAPYTLSGVIALNGEEVRKIAENFSENIVQSVRKPSEIPLDKATQFRVSYSVTDAEGKSAKAESGFILEPEIRRAETVFTTIFSDKTGTDEHFILGYCDFDKASFSTVNTDVLALVRQAISEKKEVEFIGLTDNLGTEDYNRKLALSRVESALRLLGGTDNAKAVKTDVASAPYFSNASPTGRMMNRSVVVRISKK